MRERSSKVDTVYYDVRMQKQCSRCGIVKPATEFNWRNKAKGWLRPVCRICDRDLGREYARTHLAQARERKRQWRTNNSERYAQSLKDYYAANKDREAERKKIARAANPERFAEIAHRSYEKNKAAHRAAVQRWHAKHPEFRETYQKQYYEANKAKYFDKAFARIALKKARSIQRITPKRIDARVSVFDYRCAYCGGPYEEIDHLKPLSLGGLHILANIRPSCAKCNRAKFRKPPKEWLASLKKT